MNNSIKTAASSLRAKGIALSTKGKALVATASAGLTSMLCTINAYAMDIDTDYSVNSNIADTNPEGLIIGLAVWVCRLIGIGMLIWGIYGYVTARKDGEAEAMNGAIGKLVAGLVLICMPAILKGLNIIA